jgi:hypothetical protein
MHPMESNKNQSKEKDQILKKDFQFARYVYLAVYAVLVISLIVILN